MELAIDEQEGYLTWEPVSSEDGVEYEAPAIIDDQYRRTALSGWHVTRCANIAQVHEA